jgi:hypothetical protein
MSSSVAEPDLFVFDGDVRASCALVLTADEVRDLLVLGLLESRLQPC